MAFDIQANWYFILSVLLFGVGMYGILTQKSGIRILMCVEMLLNAANINFVAFSSYYVGAPQGVDLPAGASPYEGFVYAFFVIAIAAAEAAVGLAIFVNLYRLRRSIELDQVATLRG